MAAKIASVIATNPFEVKDLIMGALKYGVVLDIDQLKSVSWQESLGFLVKKLRENGHTDFDSLLVAESDSVIKSINLIRKVDFDDFTPENIITTLSEYGISGKAYNELVAVAFENEERRQ